MASVPRIPVCGIGASAGGIEALQQFFEAVPADLGLAYVIVVHPHKPLRRFPLSRGRHASGTREAEGERSAAV